MDSQMEASIQESQQDDRIIRLQNLIEKNIEIEQHIERNTFGDSITAIENIITQAEDLVRGHEKRSANCSELLLDTELLRRNHEVVGKSFQNNSNFSDVMFCNAINNLVFNEVEDWNAICGLAIQIGNPIYTNDSMLPFIDVKPKQTTLKQRAQRKSKTITAEKRPKTSDKLERKDEGSAAVSHTLKQIRRIFRSGNNQPIPYYKLICNPNNFMETVQNGLQVSFLIKENMIALSNDDDGYPQVHVVANERSELLQAEAQQAICQLDVKFCKEMEKRYNIKEPLLKRLETD
ncbi:uncharacterized protein Nse4 [Drosophila tropicalis]|uniref:uncharacterized protein Nse4 n=1 Tax=Drosophila tropicalis TaxID=46794 RepID=UPI0035AC1E09